MSGARAHQTPRRERRPPRRPPRRRQRGVALIIALILVALATILATKLSFDGWLERRRTIGVIAAEQAFHFGMGAEALAADVLSSNGQNPANTQNGQNGQNGQNAQNLQNTQSGQNTQNPQNGQTSQNSSQVTLAQPWAQPTQPLPITPESDPEGEPIGSIQAGLEDMQGRFNLNNLARLMGDGKQDPQPLEQFQRLLVSVGLEAKWAGIARDWIDADDQPGEPDGAEDAVYTQQTPPYRTGNWPMTSPSELMNMPGFGADRYRKIAPYVTALPTALATINVCTALVLESLADNLNGEYSGSPEVLVNGRKTGCFPDVPTFTNVLGQAVASKIANRFSDKSAYFRLTTRVVLGTTQFTLYSLLWRSSGGKVTPLLRTFGTL
jgi:general secretion pathway protein K